MHHISHTPWHSIWFCQMFCFIIHIIAETFKLVISEVPVLQDHIKTQIKQCHNTSFPTVPIQYSIVFFEFCRRCCKQVMFNHDKYFLFFFRSFFSECLIELNDIDVSYLKALFISIAFYLFLCSWFCYWLFTWIISI